MKPLAVTINQTMGLVPFKRTKLSSMVKSGELESVLVGRRRMILMRSIEQLLNIEAEASETGATAGGQL